MKAILGSLGVVGGGSWGESWGGSGGGLGGLVGLRGLGRMLGGFRGPISVVSRYDWIVWGLGGSWAWAALDICFLTGSRQSSERGSQSCN